MSQLIDDLLNKAFAEIEEAPGFRRARAIKELKPDAEGCIYEIESPIKNTFDYCESVDEARKTAKAHYHEYSIWKIYVGGACSRVLVEKYEVRQKNNALKMQLVAKGFN